MAEGLSELLTCGVCMEQYDSTHHIPKLLPCQHTFCLLCLQAIEDNSHSECIVCPMCRSQHRGSAQHLTTNRLALDVAGELQKQPETLLSLRCAEHSDKDSVLICIDCPAGLCAACMKSMKTGKHAEHQLEEPSDAHSIFKAKLMDKIQQQQAALMKQNTPHCSVEDFTKAEDEIHGFCYTLISVVTRWRDDQLKTVTERKTQAAARERTIREHSAQKEAACSGVDINTLMAWLETKDKFEVQAPPVSPYDFDAARKELLHNVTSAIRPEDCSPVAQTWNLAMFVYNGILAFFVRN